MDKEKLNVLLDRIIESKPVERTIDKQDLDKHGYAFMCGVYKARLEIVLNDLESLKKTINNVL